MRQYYVPQITGLSEGELQSVFDVAEPAVCLLGGWAVHFHVNDGFQNEHGRAYIGSRDIDVGVHVDPDWTVDELREKPVGRSLQGIQELGYTESRFGFVQHFHRDTGERITEDEASQYGLHEVFQVYVDVIPDTSKLDPFKRAFGFEPPAEPLLNHVFDEDGGEPLSNQDSWSPPEEAQIVPPEVLGAMKVRSLPDREKGHKRVKDVADLHALLWYVRDYDRMKPDVLELITNDDLDRLKGAVDDDLFEGAAGLIQVDPELVAGSVRRLFW